MGSEGSGTQTEAPAGTLSALRLDLSNAKAVMSTESGESSLSMVRAIIDLGNNPLYKIMDDDTIASLFDFSSMNVNWIPTIRFMARSPVEGKKDLYICFDRSWGYWTSNDETGDDETDNNGMNNYGGSGSYTTVASFIHVKEDGSVVNITETGNNSWSQISYGQNNGNPNDSRDPVAFDKEGNLYYTVSESSNSSYTNVIYKYNPETSDVTQLTGSVTNTSYIKVLLSDDGSNIVAWGSRYNGNSNTSFLRLIPTADPDNFENIYYSSKGSSIWDVALVPGSGNIIVSGYGPNTGNGLSESGLYRVTKDPSIGNWEWTILFKGGYNPKSWYFVELSDGYNYDDESGWIEEYRWSAQFCDSEGNPDYGKIMEALYSPYLSDYVEFRFEGKTNEEALAALTQEEMKAIYDVQWDSSLWFDNYMYRTDTDEQVTVPNQNSSYFGQGLNSIIVTPNNGIWGTIIIWENNINKRTFVRLISNEGKRDFWNPKGLQDKITNSIKSSSTHVYFSADVSTGSSETGFHHLYRFSFNNPDQVQDLFVNLPADIKDTLELFSFAAGGDSLYFSGVKGTRMLTGKINLNTLEYEQMEFGHKVTNLIVY